MKVKNKLLSSITFGFMGLCFMCMTAHAQDGVPVDFPQRSSLAEIKEAQLPSTSDNTVRGPSQMEVVVSKVDPPSEQLLGRITSEVFYEMADLERANVFLKLQTQREQLRNDLEKLKASYRQARMDEIEKRESIIRTRSEWMQEQERIRQEISEKKLQAELLEKQIEEAELRKDELIVEREKAKEEALAKAAAEEAAKAAGIVETVEIVDGEEVIHVQPVEEEPEVVVDPGEAVRALQVVDVKGMKGKLTARVHGPDGKIVTLKVGGFGPNDYEVKSITRKSIVFEKDGDVQRIEVSPQTVPVEAASVM